MDTNGIVLSNTTANEYADYTFTFRTSLNVDATDSIWIKFPRDYEPYLGLSEIKYKWASPSYYYIDCSSSRLGENVECTVD